MYDADLGGWNKGDFVNDYKRYAANDSSQLTKTLARTGIGLQVQYPLNKQEKKELKRKQEKYKNKKKKKD
jgi:phosphoglycerol transferase MdoB-like AlkP superfamily enzyme